jgi:hypothetical protein
MHTCGVTQCLLPAALTSAQPQGPGPRAAGASPPADCASTAAAQPHVQPWSLGPALCAHTGASQRWRQLTHRGDSTTHPQGRCPMLYTFCGPHPHCVMCLGTNPALILMTTPAAEILYSVGRSATWAVGLAGPAPQRLVPWAIWGAGRDQGAQPTCPLICVIDAGDNKEGGGTAQHQHQQRYQQPCLNIQLPAPL